MPPPRFADSKPEPEAETEDEHTKVVRDRYERLLKMGFPHDWAEDLKWINGVCHMAEALVNAGATAQQTYRILRR